MSNEKNPHEELRAEELDDMIRVYFPSEGVNPDSDSIEQSKDLPLPDVITELLDFSKNTPGLQPLDIVFGSMSNWVSIRHHYFLEAEPALREWFEERQLPILTYKTSEVGVDIDYAEHKVD